MARSPLIFPAYCIAAVAACLILLPGCASPSADGDKKPYIDPLSGVSFPGRVDDLQRLSLNSDDVSDKKPLTAHYAGIEPTIDAGVRIIPALQATPDQIISQTVRSLETRPGFAQTDYHGLKSFNHQTAFCTECAFDNPAISGRSTLKIVIVPRGNYLVCFTFLVASSQEQVVQEDIDDFIHDILAGSKKEALMMPAFAPSENQGNGQDQ